ncbi:predicted protein [Naegleria gruberi]|uniref:Predicted protein n=1 Tax=Naegleria gruberi TaxID=5762 RepID=D2V8D5_NAEGR|nr:uncharacterized protein NAEGRDRAFT_65118 [Naegleria gruberi]EFC47025.1 predicted protein [Naegleria gruberi]|eukprot:XP_002679769.1 predicted protein [Naegleria gruberi strain NEG-M]
MQKQLTITFLITILLSLVLLLSSNISAESTTCNFDEKIFMLSPGESYFPLECTISPFNEIRTDIELVGRGITLYLLTADQKQDYLQKTKDDIYYLPTFSNSLQSFVLQDESTTSISLSSTKRMDGIDKVFILMKEHKTYTVESSVRVKILITPQQATDSSNAGAIVGGILGTFTILGLCVIGGVIGGAILWKKKILQRWLKRGGEEYQTVL